jgi:trehalose-phosphatase
MKLFLFLDFDGTLAPIADTPQKARLPRSTGDLLRKLAQKPGCRVAIVSGRALNDIQKQVGLKNIIYAGNHGWEMEGPGLRFKVRLTKQAVRTLQSVFRRLEQDFASTRGILIEDKGSTVSFHYRLADPVQVPSIKRMFRALIRPFVENGEVRVNPGKMVYEINPPLVWDKGKAVRYILSWYQAENALPFYIGDDVNDERAFRELRKTGITVRVGKKSGTAARYWVRDIDGVTKLLKAIDQMKW